MIEIDKVLRKGYGIYCHTLIFIPINQYILQLNKVYKMKEGEITMKVNLNKDKFKAIEGAFLVLIEDPNNMSAKKIIKDNLDVCFGSSFSINIVQPQDIDKSGLFVMSVFPETSTIDKIISAVLENKESDVIKKLWGKNTVWTIEIDRRILSDSSLTFTEKELTAMLLHEVGHVVCSTSIINRISVILRYEIAKTSMRNKMLLNNKIFSSILSLPILDSCISDGKRSRSSIKEEIKADKFVKSMGYQDELYTVLTKIANDKRYPKTNDINQKMTKTATFSLDVLDDINTRKAKLGKEKLLQLRESIESPFIQDFLTLYEERVFGHSDYEGFESNKELVLSETVDDIIDGQCVKEFFLFGGKDLKRLDPSEIDYIDVKISAMKTETDKMMIISYIHSKLDMVNYYISIMQNNKLRRKYNVPHTLDQLFSMKKRLENLREIALKFRLPEKYKGILVAYPTGYEG